jgi:hypothetical protein
MIGTNIRGIRHLWRVADTSLQKILVRCNEHGYDICEVVKTEKDNPLMGERMFIFNSYYNQNNYGFTSITSYSKELKKELKDIEHSRILEVRPRHDHDNFTEYNVFFNEIYLLPKTFDKDYEAFLKENAKMIKTLSDKIGFNTKDVRIKRLYIYTDGSKNFFQWAVNLHYQHGVSMRTIQNILTWNEYYNQLSKNLSKGSITAYTTPDAIAKLLEELSELRNGKRINDAINSFNTAQKKLLKTNELSETDNKTLARFSKLSDTKRINFIKKVSTIEDFQELMRQMRHITSVHFEWNKDSFMDFIRNVEGIKYETIYESDNVVLVKVADYETIKQLGKTTNWCISKNKSYWNNYIENHHGKTTQYMIFDFSKLEDEKLSIVGFTTTYNKGITSAHDFVNNNLMVSDNNAMQYITSYLSRFDTSKNIYKIMQDCNIDITLVAHYDKPLYKWDREALMDYLYECVNAENVDIIKSDGDKLVLSVTDENIKYFLGDAYMDNVSSDDWGEQHIIFIDFSMSQYDPNKLQFAIIYDGGSDEDYCNAMYNETSTPISNNFDAKLIEFGVPYDIIRRTDDNARKFKNAFLNFNTPMIKDCLEKDKNVMEIVLNNYIDNDHLYHLIKMSVNDYLSFDYLDIFYDNGYILSQFLDEVYISELFKMVFNNMKNYGKRVFENNNFKKPSKEDIEAFYNRSIADRNFTVYVGNYILMKMLLEKEVSNEKTTVVYSRHYGRVITNIFSSSLVGDVIKEILLAMINRLDFNQRNDATTHFIRYSVMYGDEELKEITKNISNKHEWAKKLCNDLYEQIKDSEKFAKSNRTPWSTVATVTTTMLNDLVTVGVNPYNLRRGDD